MSTVRTKKDVAKPSNPPPTMPKPVAQEHNKKVPRRSSKPIINWFQRKLAGTVRARRASESQRYGASSPRGKTEKQHRRSSVPMPPPLSVHSRTRSNGTRAHSLRGTISLNESQDDVESRSFRSVSDDGITSSAARESLYSPASYLEADDDASLRPLPPSSPPSPAPSRDSSSYLSHSRTFRSMAASTKPTTLLSVDLTGGMAHIAQAPPTPTTPGSRIPPHIRTHSAGLSAGSITFSAFLPSSPSRPSSGNSGAAASPRATALSAPLYTSHHPRNNPRPSSPPPDDASMLTLASSAFGFPNARIGVGAFALSGRGSIADDAISQWSHTVALTDSASHLMMTGDVEEGMEEGGRYVYPDVDASVRALRPRSSRRGSWDSAVSGWSANVPGSAVLPSPGGAKSKSMWTGSVITGTGGISVDGGRADDNDVEEEEEEEGNGDDLRTEEGVESKMDSLTASSLTSDGATPSVVPAILPPADQPMEGFAELSTTVMPGSKADLPADIVSTATLAGSKTRSEIPSPPGAPTDPHQDGASTPTKTEVAPVELSQATTVLSLDASNPDLAKVTPAMAVHQALSDAAPQESTVEASSPALLSPAQTEYLSPSTPAAA
ncbi:uncharacterized protein BXZ73DRAFT_40354 [Epithele typhae]|uniref:uncharacterized protein n=1 Tax=Epithele typhae TaxID=378194 RepID=UPI0020072B9E|nr:uncharacterized protein BXZ73DRAFT_40354 [Epithele typhae]KAH9943056.1 hypothetical protein BXZ73DRAFT_40354 [Epithele typhae]